MDVPLSVIVLTFNEEKNIRKLLDNIKDWANQIVVVDSFSTDKTLEICKEYNVDIYQNSWVNHAEQMKWALQNVELRNEWIMRLDADEELTPELKLEIAEALKRVPLEVNGFYMKRRVYFMNKWIRHGGFYPQVLLRIWRKGYGKIEEKNMDEHIIVTGKTILLKSDFIDRNNKDLTFWVDKHNQYATREMADILRGFQISRETLKPGIIGPQAVRKRWAKEHIYLKLPLFVRPFLYFLYRYFLLFGFLDGVEGLIFHFLQAFWYRFLVDAKIYEARVRQK